MVTYSDQFQAIYQIPKSNLIDLAFKRYCLLQIAHMGTDLESASKYCVKTVETYGLQQVFLLISVIGIYNVYSVQVVQ